MMCNFVEICSLRSYKLAKLQRMGTLKFNPNIRAIPITLCPSHQQHVLVGSVGLQDFHGAELQDSPRAPSSVASSKRDDMNFHHSQPHVMTQGSIPIQGQVLVDPATGQHYIVPQATFFPPSVQPMYFQAPPTPVYYPYGQVPTQGYVMQSAPPQAQYSVPIAAYQQRPYTFRPGYAPSTASSEDISRRDDERRLADFLFTKAISNCFAEDPPPSSPSISMASQSSFFPPNYCPPTTTSFAQQYRHHPNPQRSSPNSQPEDPESGRDGFRRDVTRSSSEFQRLSGEFRRQGSSEFGRSTEMFSRSGNVDSARSEAYYRAGSGGSAEGESFNRVPSDGKMTERTPLYGGPPPWWGRQNREDHGESLTDVESPRTHPRSTPPESAHSESESGRTRQIPAKAVRMDIDFSKVGEDEVPRPKPTTSRSVRMDIDLSKLPDETQTTEKKVISSLPEDADQLISVVHAPLHLTSEYLVIRLPKGPKAKSHPKALPMLCVVVVVSFNPAPSRVAATAFTVNFDSADEELSLQDAARKSAQARRILGRRSGGGGSATSSGSQDSGQRTTDLPQGQTTNKRYLLNKLLQGEGQNADETTTENTEVEERKECDVTSEAGTYVVDLATRVGSGPASQLMTAKIIEHSDASSDSDSDSDSDTNSDGSAIPRQKIVSLPPKSPTVKPTPAQPEKKDNNRDDLVKELAKLRSLAGIRPTTSPAEPRAASNVTRPMGLYDNSRPGPATPPQLPRPSTGRPSHGSQHSNRSSLPSSKNSSAASTNAPFRRGEGGRYSMRGNAPGVAPSSPQQNVRRPPFRAGVAPLRTYNESLQGGNPAQQKEQEMNAWLRRKDYNPMKAAAEARKAKELKARGEQFVSNRSISFHVGPVAARPAKREGFGEITRNRSQESLALEEAEHASQRVIAEYSRGVVQDISRLSQQSSRASGKLSGLARAVDMLSQKCKKSIELIRSQNKGCLSVSVEDLLAAAAEPPRKGETLNEQLDRLSDAFDAVQR
ncbi:unnamed protein product [Nippostrongylus brasiliensis]|uniref:MIF4G domain-containing protein n=1 Tax=Nippostrongylus brasiliensis TaxID=27835 RepID=A0A0N4XDW6_NIPBR|nr:unnamed protein product [Nippostrongylus brasiliensis]